MIKHLLVTTDFSKCSEAAFTRAQIIQRMLSARLTLLTILDEEADSAGALVRMHDFRRGEFSGSEISTAVVRIRNGVPKDIVDYASTHQVDLIVIASHGRTGARRLMFGSVSEALLREARCPVLIVPSHEHHNFSGHDSLNISVLTDFSVASERALPIAKYLFNAFGSADARLTLLHISENMLDATFGRSLGVDAHAVREEAEVDAEARLSELAGRYFGGTLAMTASIRGLKSVPEEVIEYAECHNVDLIVMAMHEHSMLEQMLVGSVAEKLIRKAGKMLLIVPQALAT